MLMLVPPLKAKRRLHVNLSTAFKATWAWGRNRARPPSTTTQAQAAPLRSASSLPRPRPSNPPSPPSGTPSATEPPPLPTTTPPPALRAFECMLVHKCPNTLTPPQLHVRIPALWPHLASVLSSPTWRKLGQRGEYESARHTSGRAAANGGTQRVGAPNTEPKSWSGLSPERTPQRATGQKKALQGPFSPQDTKLTSPGCPRIVHNRKSADISKIGKSTFPKEKF